MIGSDKKIVPVTLPREDVERIEQLKKPISEFCRDAVHERLRAVEMARENTVQDWMYSDGPAPELGQDVYKEETKPDLAALSSKPDSDWSKLFAKV
jgi:hypothetical protein